MIKKIRQIAKEEPTWLAVLIVGVTAVLTAINILLTGFNMNWW